MARPDPMIDFAELDGLSSDRIVKPRLRSPRWGLGSPERETRWRRMTNAPPTRATRQSGQSPQCRGSTDEPSPVVDIELHQPFIAHSQQEGLASFLIHDVGALHDFVDFERFLAESAQDIFSIIQHDQTPTNFARSLRIRKLIFRNHPLNIL